MAGESRPHGSVRVRSIQRSIQDQLDRLPEDALLQPPEFRRGHERSLLLWRGTLQLLEAQAPQAYALVMAKLERHGLAGRELVLQHIAGVPHASERAALVAGVWEADPSDRTLQAVRAYARDEKRVRVTGRRRRLTPRILLVMAYDGARWKLTTEKKSSGLPLRGDAALEERAVALVARRYGLSDASAHALIKRARVALHPTWRRWIASLDGATLWGLAMAPEVAIPRLQGERKT